VATRARFGRLPRSAPSLTATIVALANEYQRVRESNIVDAWKNGGMFEGHRVTDKQILEWFKGRRDELDPSDPMWNYYDNQVREYDFSIENSKMELAYKRHKVTDGQMVAFYHKWAGKLPTYSEGYREREKLAAAYADRAANRGSGGSRARSDAAYQNQRNAELKKELPYDATMMFLEAKAHDTGILHKNETLANIDPLTADGKAILRLWDDIANSPDYADDRADWTKWVRENGNPNFKGDFSQDATRGYLRTKKGSVGNRLALANKTGHRADATAAEKERDNVRSIEVQVSGWDETAAYEDARQDWQNVANDPNSTILQIDRANAKYVGQLQNIADRLGANLRIGEHDDRIGYLTKEIATMNGDEHPYMQFGGSVGPGDNTGGTESTRVAQWAKQNASSLQLLAMRDENGLPLYVQTKVVEGRPVPVNERTNPSLNWGVVPIGDMDPNSFNVVQTDGDDPRAATVVTSLAPTPIYLQAEMNDEDTGEPAGIKTAPNPSAWRTVLPDGTITYKYKDSTGKTWYTPDNPFGTTITNPDGSVDMTDNQPSLTPKDGYVTVPNLPGQTYRYSLPGEDEAFKPSYYNGDANTAMTSRLGKSTYASWLIGSDPKKRAVYAQSPDSIMATLRLDAGKDLTLLPEMVLDADDHRSVYLGNSTQEQQRFRNNALNGNPNPVSLDADLKALGYKEGGKEQHTIDLLTKGKSDDQLVEDIREGNRAGLKAVTPKEFNTPTHFDPTDRKYWMPSSTAQLKGPTTIPATSLGAQIPKDIADTLRAGIQNSVNGQPLVAGGRVSGGTYGGRATAGGGWAVPSAGPSPKATTPPPSPKAPEPPKPNKSKEDRESPDSLSKKPFSQMPVHEEKVFNRGGR